MRLIGMLDSPYVRRVAISLKVMGIPFEHEPTSVIREYDAFSTVNPVVKAPTLVLDTGVVLMDSTLILENLEYLTLRGRRLRSPDPRHWPHELRTLGLALAACEKTVQIVYEQNLRPPEKRHQPWFDRLCGQLTAAYETLEAELPARPRWSSSEDLTQGDLTTAVAWRFTQHIAATAFPAERYPHLTAHSVRAEALPAFLSTPLEPTV
ncbi:MAG: glutathione S-transferase [Caulobacteraceae bacterium]|nr:glutathione S-transferase [Caulobacteraceae bacterium]